MMRPLYYQVETSKGRAAGNVEVRSVLRFTEMMTTGPDQISDCVLFTCVFVLPEPRIPCDLYIKTARQYSRLT